MLTLGLSPLLLQPDTCDIEGRCYQTGQAKSLEEPLHQCQPSSEQYGWTDLTPPETTTATGAFNESYRHNFIKAKSKMCCDHTKGNTA